MQAVGTAATLAPVPSTFKLRPTAPSWCEPIGVIEKSKRGGPRSPYLVLECSCCPDQHKRDCLEVRKNLGESWDSPRFMTRLDNAINAHRWKQTERKVIHDAQASTIR